LHKRVEKGTHEGAQSRWQEAQGRHSKIRFTTGNMEGHAAMHRSFARQRAPRSGWSWIEEVRSQIAEVKSSAPR
jgi:hypothetical protein